MPDIIVVPWACRAAYTCMTGFVLTEECQGCSMPDILDVPWACRAAYIRLQKQKQQAQLTGLPHSPTRSLSREGSLASSLGTPGARLPATSGKTVSMLVLRWPWGCPLASAVHGPWKWSPTSRKRLVMTKPVGRDMHIACLYKVTSQDSELHGLHCSNLQGPAWEKPAVGRIHQTGLATGRP